MKNFFVVAVLSVLILGCRKVSQEVEKIAQETPSAQFVQYLIRQGQQYCDQSSFRPVELNEMSFAVRFDSTAVYRAQAAENQYDINKLYGFSDNGMDHHQYSARIGWRWSDDSLRLFAYVYNAGAVSSRELSSIRIGSEIHCSIKVSGNQYLFTVNDHTEQLARSATTEKIKGYQLFPYFGGNEVAPHDIRIWIKDDRP
jgi:hypothetical protein